MVASQQDQAEQAAIVELGEVVTDQPLQPIDVGQVLVGVARRTRAQAHQVDAEYADVTDGTQLPSDAAGFSGRTLLAEDRQGGHAGAEVPAVSDNRRGLDERYGFGHEVSRRDRAIEPVRE